MFMTMSQMSHFYKCIQCIRNHWHIFQCRHQDEAAKLNLEEALNAWRLNFNFQSTKKSAKTTATKYWWQSKWRSVHMCCARSVFFSRAPQVYRCVCLSESRFSSLQCFNHSKHKHKRIDERKKMNASLPVVGKRHRDLSLSTLPMHHHSIVCFCVLPRKRTHASYTHTKSIHKAARLSVQIHSNRNRCDMIGI